MVFILILEGDYSILVTLSELNAWNGAAFSAVEEPVNTQ